MLSAPAVHAETAPVPFLVTSAGQSGSVWFASSLHRHPDILCSAGVDHPLLSLSYDHNPDEVARIRASIRGAGDFPFGVASHLKYALEKGGFFNLSNHFEGDPYREVYTPLADLPDRMDVPVATILFGELAMLPKIKPYKAFGNVHGVTSMKYMEEMRKGDAAFSGYSKDLTVMDLIRHPITRLDSIVNLYTGADQQGSCTDMLNAELKKRESKMEALRQRYDVDFSQSINRVFFWIEYILMHSRGWAADIMAVPEHPRLLFERLQSDREYFRDTVHTLTRGTVVADDAYLDKIFSSGNLGAGRFSSGSARKTRKDPKAVYESWPLWQQKEVARTYKEYDLVKVYEPLGYDLSFLVEI